MTAMYTDVSTFCVDAGCAIQSVIQRMNENRLGIVLVVTEEGRLMGIITDGDIRRAILAKIELTSSIQSILSKKEGTLYSKPLSALAGQSHNVYLKLLKEHSVLHLPILDKEKRVVGLVTMDEFVEGPPNPGLQAVVMAGGLGTRLHPLTEDIPKPMLLVGERPLLEIIINQLRSIGIRRVNITTHHKPEKIRSHFGNGENFGVQLNYVSENKPLGTAGSLGLLETPQETLLVINGDVLTQVDFKAMLQYHREHSADLTVGVRSFDFKVPYGVVECEGSMVSDLKEKPSLHFLVNAGIYLLEPSAHQYIPSGDYFNMTDLIQKLLEAKRVVASFPIHEYWLDIGSHTEYQQAQEEAQKFAQKE